MRLALFGQGKMGRAVTELAGTAGHKIGVVFRSADAGRTAAQLAELVRNHDVAVDFSRADAVVSHVAACAQAGVPLVEGTTGWQEQEAAVRHAMDDASGALVYGSNFSIGVNLFYLLVDRAGQLFRGLADYDAFIEEAHHAQKRDAPSGTALRLRDLLAVSYGRPVPVASTRAGHIPGTHRVGFDSSVDQIMLEHTARSRNGFAHGALLAAEWIVSRRGVYAFDEVLEDILHRNSGLPGGGVGA